MLLLRPIGAPANASMSGFQPLMSGACARDPEPMKISPYAALHNRAMSWNERLMSGVCAEDPVALALPVARPLTYPQASEYGTFRKVRR